MASTEPLRPVMAEGVVASADEAAARPSPSIDAAAGSRVGGSAAPHPVEDVGTVSTSPGGGLHERGDPGLPEESHVGQGASEPSATADTAVGAVPSSPSGVVPSAPIIELPASMSVGAGDQARSPPRAAAPPPAVVVEEIARAPTPEPQLVRMVIRRGNQFEVLEEDVADAEIRRLRADLTAMMTRIEVSDGSYYLLAMVFWHLIFFCDL